MSVHMIYYKDGAKMMRPVLSREEYLKLRGSAWQKSVLKAVREGKESQKSMLIQMNYSCLPGEGGHLKGSTQMSTTVGMDIDHIAAEEMPAVKERILAKKDELGLLMLETSARKAGYHLVFRRRPEMTQEENLRWASELLKVEYDAGAKDITRVFFTTSASDDDLLFLSDDIFEIVESETNTEKTNTDSTDGTDYTSDSGNSCSEESLCSEKDYNGLPYSEIIRKWWELYNEGKEPVRTNRDVLTFELAVNLRHICGFDRELMDAVIPCYDGFSETQK
ncbi:MAG: hypothetical protein J5698_00005, partial [Bacteroidaceae bacterium]|nr:hypothetical protein [Bacteroidaceae bacterium]